MDKWLSVLASVLVCLILSTAILYSVKMLTWTNGIVFFGLLLVASYFIYRK